jgi:hypothetical protein
MPFSPQHDLFASLRRETLPLPELRDEIQMFGRKSVYRRQIFIRHAA